MSAYQSTFATKVMMSGFTTLFLYVYLGVMRHRLRKGRADESFVERAYSSVELTFSFFLIGLISATFLNAFRDESWVQWFCWLPTMADIAGAIAGLSLGFKTERLYKKKTANQSAHGTR